MRTGAAARAHDVIETQSAVEALRQHFIRAGRVAERAERG